jgi:hypothetical protein
LDDALNLGADHPARTKFREQFVKRSIAEPVKAGNIAPELRVPEIDDAVDRGPRGARNTIPARIAVADGSLRCELVGNRLDFWRLSLPIALLRSAATVPAGRRSRFCGGLCPRTDAAIRRHPLAAIPRSRVGA